jgi:hypothetical protein
MKIHGRWLCSCAIYFFLFSTFLNSQSSWAQYDLQKQLFGQLKFPDPPLPYQYTTNADEKNKQKVLRVFSIGDSLQQRFHSCSDLCMAWQILAPAKAHGFIDVDPSPQSIDSLYEKLARLRPVATANLGVAGASVIRNPSMERAGKQLKILSFKEQVSAILAMNIAPDLTFVWIGHNDLNLLNNGWTEAKLEHDFRIAFTDQLYRLISILTLRNPNQKKAVVVFALANLEKVFAARKECEKRKAANPELFPFYDLAEQHFGLLRKFQQSQAIRMSKVINETLKEAVDLVNLSREDHFQNVELRFSNDIYGVEKLTCDDLSPMDAYHPSPSGHQMVANSLFREAQKSLEFLDF